MGKNKMHLKKESADQETKNLLTEDPVADREKDTILMKRGQRASIMKHMSPIGKYDHSYKKTTARIARDEAANAAWDNAHGYGVEGKYEAEQAAKEMNRKDGKLFGRRKKKKGSMFSGGFRSSDGRVKGSARPTTSRG